MLSCFLVQREFSRMSNSRNLLRVSEPRGIQRSSYFISLPLRYGLPLYATSGLMHWLVSQSLFLARVTAFFPDGTVDQASSFSTCGYSPIAVFFSKTPCSSKPFDNESLTVLFTGILVGIFLVLCLIGIGFFNYDGTMPVVSTNSRAISAACHVLEEDERYGYLLPVKWGVVQRQNGVGRCAMSTAYDIKMPNSALLYS